MPKHKLGMFCRSGHEHHILTWKWFIIRRNPPISSPDDMAIYVHS